MRPKPVPGKTASRESSRPRRDTPAVELSLAIGREGLGFELAKPARLACLQVTELALSLPAVRFPVDVSGGVQRFRHRRGRLERVTVEIDATDLTKYWAPRLRGLLAESTPALWISARPWGATVGITDDASRSSLVFEVALVADDDALRLLPFSVRGLRLSRPAVALAADALAAGLGASVEREGAAFIVHGAPARLVRSLLPDAGARAPETVAVRFGAITAAADAWILHASRGAIAPEQQPEGARARELLHLARASDDARVEGDLERARVLDLHALERAPRHPELCARIADLDRVVGGRVDAARSTLEDAASAIHLGFLAGELAAAAGDMSSAVAALRSAADAETVPALAALAWAMASELSTDAFEALTLLDRAIARAPSLASLRWGRLARRLALGRLRDALADAEELEALAHGPRARHETWTRAATLWITAGHAAEARPLFERALRFMPDDPQANAGLGAALLARGNPSRGVQLLARALSLPDPRKPFPRELETYRIVLAEALANQLDDRPAAIARLADVPDEAPEAPLARGLEGRYRAALGDGAGASLAYAALRDRTLRVPILDPLLRSRIRELLLEAIAFESGRDRALAQSHGTVAMRLFPQDGAVQTAYRQAYDAEPHAPRTEPPPELDDDDESRAEELLSRFHRAPDDDAIVDELSTVLARLGRSHELLALLSARLEEATPERRTRLLPLQLAVLARLERDARQNGHDNEAQLFRDALAALGGGIVP